MDGKHYFCETNIIHPIKKISIMTLGKHICETLKEVRRQIARANDIPYEPAVCPHKGDCLGTCPKCEQELKDIELALDRRRTLGKAVSIVGVSMGVAALSSCHMPPFGGGQEAGYLIDPSDTLQGDSIASPLTEIPTATDGFIREQIADTLSQSCSPSTMVSKSATGEEDVFGAQIEQNPSFPGGPQALKTFITRHLNYPDSLRKMDIEGTVITSFIVEADGSISDAKVVRPIHPQLDEEALRVIHAMPKWKPATQGNHAVRVKYTMPIIFQP